MKTYFLAAFLLTPVAFNAGAQSLQTTVSKIKSLKQASFTEVVKCKFSFQEDFSVDTFKTWLTVVPAEPQIGCYFKIEGRGATYLFDGSKGVALYKVDSTYKVQPEYWVGGQNTRTLLPLAKNMEGYLKTPSKINRLPDTLIGKTKYTHYFVRQTDSVSKGDHIYSYIDIITYKATGLPFMVRMDSQGYAGDGARMGMVEQHTFTGYNFREKNFPDLSVANIPLGYHLPVKKEQLPMLTVGTKAPVLNLKDLKGASFDMAGLRGKMILLNFSLIGCPHCANAAQMLTRLNDQYKNNGLEIISIYQDGLDNPKGVGKFDNRMGVKYPSYFTARSAAKAYHINGYPQFYLLDKAGKIVQGYEGFYPELEKQIAEKLAFMR